MAVRRVTSARQGVLWNCLEKRHDRIGAAQRGNYQKRKYQAGTSAAGEGQRGGSLQIVADSEREKAPPPPAPSPPFATQMGGGEPREWRVLRDLHVLEVAGLVVDADL